ncbi:uncharacterized protein B0H64DRAFT_456322 [Chaetomium fimeti]|uniref:Essential protein Yae1 N-terminal domain-containing protein n=1 Tax=Chaetomium fimeti TaxID=1854472 RepID=A0AAE0HJI1_9PEZI|nr:hypothetical protein B0H64DRAFT_456322 [Chaetomium fimeti]
MTTTAQQPLGSDDPFDTLLTLEDQFYTEGYDQGMADGLVAGRAEGRQLGLERGFVKFAESGRLQGRAIVWASRAGMGMGREGGKGQAKGGVGVAGEGGDLGVGLGSGSGLREGGEGEGDGQGREDGVQHNGDATEVARVLPPLPDNPRLAKHITTLYALAETESLSTENNDEAVDDFDDRLRRAQGRFKVIERMVGEGDSGRPKGDGQGDDPGAGPGKREGVPDV